MLPLILVCLLFILTGLWGWQYRINKKLELSIKEKNKNPDYFHQQYNQMITEVAHLIEDAVKKKKFELEREQAIVIQKVLNNHFNTSSENVDVSGVIISAEECSGDWWYSYEDDDNIYVWLGDVTGHGVSAAIIASACRSLIMGFEKGQWLPLSEQANLLNSVIFEMFEKQSLVTFRALSINKDSLTCEVLNGSHPDLILKSQNSMEMIQGNLNPPLGMKQNHQYKTSFLTLQNDSQIILLTDGLLELTPTSNERWNSRHQFNFFKNLDHLLESKACLENIKEKVHTLVNNKSSWTDDITIVCIKIKKSQKLKKSA